MSRDSRSWAWWNLFTISADHIHEATVELTMLEGRAIYRNVGWPGARKFPGK